MMAIFALLLAGQVVSTSQAPLAYRIFDVKEPGEAVAVIRASCERCDWGVEGREAAALRVSVDGRYSQHLLLARGHGSWEYQLTLGPVASGTHRLFVHLDAALSARDLGKVT